MITRRDYVASSDSERKTFLVYNADGSLRKVLFENAQSVGFLTDLEGFDPQTLFISHDGLDYIFYFMNMRTYEFDLEMNYGLKADENDDPDYIMANIDRTLTPDGKSYCYVAEMKMPEYDDINDRTFMRVAWISKDGKLERIDKVNMGNSINYAKLYLGSAALKSDFFHSDDNNEYMMLIKRAVDGGAQSVEELLIGQAVSEEYPEGRDLLLLGESEHGKLNTITPFTSEHGNTLQVVYTSEQEVGQPDKLTICYYDLPLDRKPETNGIGAVEGEKVEFAIEGSTIVATGSSIEVITLQGVSVAKGADRLNIGHLAKGIYIVSIDGRAVKLAL